MIIAVVINMFRLPDRYFLHRQGKFRRCYGSRCYHQGIRQPQNCEIDAGKHRPGFKLYYY